MKVFYNNSDAPQKQRVSIDVQFNINSLNWEELINDQHILIPCCDSSIIRELGAPLTLCAWVDDILYPDLDSVYTNLRQQDTPQCNAPDLDGSQK